MNKPDRSQPVATIPLKGMRGVVARQMLLSLRDGAQLTLHRIVDAGGMTRFRSSFDAGSRPTYNDIMLACAVAALTRHPEVNATLEEDVIRQWGHVNIGFAVAVDAGLVVPVIHEAQAKTLDEIAAATADLGARAREGKLKMPEIADGTFTVSNLGALGIDFFTPIISPPQVAILGVGRIHEGRIGLSLTIDHRALDGAPGARFLGDLASALATPEDIIGAG
jgi:pyruvate dehydrogenase E2 component (dihydrolipoamide acetyltransferase)